MSLNTGILLINLGTPKSTSVSDVKSFIREFLLDPHVIDLPSIPRWILVNGFILPLRLKRIVKAYQQIWTDEGSPLLLHSEALKEGLKKQLGNGFRVELGMRYGSPSIASAIQNLKQEGCDRLIVLPLFPQYSYAATASAIDTIDAIKQDHSQIINDFFDRDWFIKPYASLIKKHLEAFNPDFVLFSYHGLPERQIKKSCHTATECDHEQACPSIHPDNRGCYRAQCFATSRALANALHLQPSHFSTSFQSRIGRASWAKPYTNDTLIHLYKNGIRRLAIACPSFTVDCLETLEEIGIRAKHQWLSLGSPDFLLIPSLNSDDNWILALSSELKRIKLGD